jgi:hypothetical protein
MAEIIAAIIGALIGGLFALLLSRKRPSYIVCEVQYQGRFSLPFSETRILFRDNPIDELYLTRLSFRNMGTQVLEKPAFTVKFRNVPHVLGVSVDVSPDRALDDTLLCETAVQENVIRLEPTIFYPYQLNQEVLTIDVFTRSDAAIAGVIGHGVNRDGTGWSVRFGGSWVSIPLLGAVAPTRKALIYGLGMYFVFLLTIVMLIGYLGWHVLSGLIIVNAAYFRTMLRDPLLLVILVWSVIIFSVAFTLALRGWFLPIPLPFKRVLTIRIGIGKR